MAISAPAILFHQRLSRRPIVSCQNRRFGAEISQFFLPALRMALFRFGHAQKNASAFLIPLAFGQIAIRLRRLDFRLPIASYDFDRLASIFRVMKWIFAVHLPAQSAGSIAGRIADSALALSCCVVITMATEPIISAPAIKTRRLKVSPAKAAPNKTATIGFTYA